MKTEHTPGPWRTMSWDGAIVISGPMDELITTVGDRQDGAIPQEQTRNNARLIAAAPELLEALKTIVELNLFNDSIKGFDKAQKAIQKATQP